MKSLVRPLWDLRSDDAKEVGGKALGLARLMDLGVEVPPGFVVTASFFLEVRSREPQEPEAEALSERIPQPLQQEIETALETLGSSPAGYAVRSSAVEEDSRTASFAGIHESYLGVGREEVLRHVFRCWAWAFSDRAAAYRARVGLPTDPAAFRMGVVVQRMLRPSVSGVLFTRDPESGDEALRIQAVEGLGDKLAQGSVTPASVRVPRPHGAASFHPEAPFPLDPPRLEELVEVALRLEAAWGCPLDLEWAVDSERLHFLQARPITRLAREDATLTGEGGEGDAHEDVLWTRANLRELLPELPSPLFVSLTEGIDWAANSRRLGMPLRPGDRVIRFIEGRPFFNLSLIDRWAGEFGLPLSHFTRALGHDVEISQLPPEPPRLFRAFLRSPFRMMGLMRMQASAPRRLRRFMARANEEARRLRAIDSSALSDLELGNLLRSATDDGTDFIFHLQVAFHRVTGSLLPVDALIPKAVDREAFLGAVLAAGEKSISVRQGMDLVLLAHKAREEPEVIGYLSRGKDDFRDFAAALSRTRFLAEFRRYLEDYGHRGVHESDPAMPVYAEKPGFLLKTLAALVADAPAPDPESTFRGQILVARKAWEDLRRRLSAPERALPWRILLLKGCVKRLQEAMIMREQVRFEGMRVGAEHRRFLHEAGWRLQRRGLLDSAEDLPWLRIEEIDRALSGALDGEEARRRMAQRRADRERHLAVEMPNLLRESEIGRLPRRGRASSDGTGHFQGIPVGPGRVEGRAVVLEGPHQIDRIVRGDILVAPTLDPSWVPLFTLASGLVVEMGGTLSHGSIIAREYGLPAVVNLPGITRVLKTGDRIVLDGSAGTVHRLQPDS